MRLLCWLGFHKIYIINILSPVHRDAGCLRCKGKWRFTGHLSWKADNGLEVWNGYEITKRYVEGLK